MVACILRRGVVLVASVACTAPVPTPDANDDGVRYPRLGLRCECDDGTANTAPCVAAACGPAAACVWQRCTSSCTATVDCPAGAWCDPTSHTCWWTCSTDADCVDRDVTTCAPVGVCAEP